jgi:hypothetical protein
MIKNYPAAGVVVPCSRLVVFSTRDELRQDLWDDSLESLLDGGQCVFFRQLDLPCGDQDPVNSMDCCKICMLCSANN